MCEPAQHYTEVCQSALQGWVIEEDALFGNDGFLELKTSPNTCDTLVSFAFRPVVASMKWPLILALATLVTALSAPNSRAELVMVDSLAMRARAADVILVGRVLDVIKSTKVVKGRTHQMMSVSLASKRVLKGQAIKVYTYVDDANDQLKSGQRVLVFLSEADRFPKRFPAHFKGELTPTPMNSMNRGPVLDLAKLPAVGLPTRDFKLVTTEKDIVTRIKAALATKGIRPGRASLEAPLQTSPVGRAFYSGSSVMVTVPLDDVTLAVAVAGLSHKQVWPRNEAVQILAHFKSKANIGRLKGLLSDPGIARRTTKGQTTDVYLVRETAYATLQKWGVKVAQPQLVK